MTNENAKERIGYMINHTSCFEDTCDGECEKCVEAYKKAFEALEKRIPIKPIDGYIYGKEPKCPACMSIIPTYEKDGDDFYSDFCNCGQHIDWSNEDDEEN